MGLRRRLVKSLLRQYVKDLQDRHIHVDVRRGCVLIDDATLQTQPISELLSGLLPAGWELTEAHAAHIQLDIPWNKLRSQSTVLNVGSVRAVVRVHPCATCGLGEEPCAHWSATVQRRLAELRDAQVAAKSGLAETGGLSQIVTGGLQVAVDNIEARLEYCAAAGPMQTAPNAPASDGSSLLCVVRLGDVFWGPRDPCLKRLTRFVPKESVALTSRELRIEALSVQIGSGRLLHPTSLTLRIHSSLPSDGRNVCPFSSKTRVELDLPSIYMDGEEQQLQALFTALLDLMDSEELLSRRLGRKPWSDAEHDALQDRSVSSRALGSSLVMQDAKHPLPEPRRSSSPSDASGSSKSGVRFARPGSGTAAIEGVTCAAAADAKVQTPMSTDTTPSVPADAVHPESKRSGKKFLSRFVPGKRTGQGAAAAIKVALSIPAAAAARGTKLARQAKRTTSKSTADDAADEDLQHIGADDGHDDVESIEPGTFKICGMECVDASVPSFSTPGGLSESSSSPRTMSSLRTKDDMDESEVSDVEGDNESSAALWIAGDPDALEEMEAAFFTPSNAQGVASPCFRADDAAPMPSGDNPHSRKARTRESPKPNAQAVTLHPGVARNFILTVQMAAGRCSIRLPPHDADSAHGRADFSCADLAYQMSKLAWLTEAEQACVARVGGRFDTAVTEPPDKRGSKSADGVVLVEHEVSLQSCDLMFSATEIDESRQGGDAYGSCGAAGPSSIDSAPSIARNGLDGPVPMLQASNAKDEILTAKWRGASGEPCPAAVADGTCIAVWPVECVVQSVCVSASPRHWQRLQAVFAPAIAGGVRWEDVQNHAHLVCADRVDQEAMTRSAPPHRAKAVTLRNIDVQYRPCGTGALDAGAELPTRVHVNTMKIENVSEEFNKISSLLGLDTSVGAHLADVEDMSAEEMRAELRMWRQRAGV